MAHIYRTVNLFVLFTVALTLLWSSGASAQDQKLPKFNNLRFEENWDVYDASPEEHSWLRAKRIELSPDGKYWLSVGGELRTRVEAWDNFGWTGGNDEIFLLNRFHLHTDWHLGESWRVFVEGRMNTISDRELPGGERDALDWDELDLQNTFIEWSHPVGESKFTARIGREELQFGRQVHLSPLDWANNRRIFEGGHVSFKMPKRRIDAFVTRPVMIDGDNFNQRNNHRVFSGLYYTQPIGETGYSFDAYLFAQNSQHNGGPRDEDRYTVGGRFYGSITPKWSIEAHAAYQFGEEDAPTGAGAPGSADIQAYMFILEATYKISTEGWKPWVTVGLDHASGDNDTTDGDDETFRQLYPLGHAYLGYIDAVGRQNITDLRVTVGAWPHKKVRVKADLHNFWLADDDDNLYHAGGGIMRAAMPGQDDRVGTELDLTLLYKWNRYANFLFGYSYFAAGDMIDDTGSDDDIHFGYAQFGLQF